MTTEQLQAARAEKWRQKANPVLTLEDAETWIGSTGVSLFIPRKTQLQAPAPSFVEAVLGETNATPPPAAIQNALDFAARLSAADTAIPLNLLGAISEQPDFLVSPEALPYVFALRGDREWKRGPRDKSSPLVVESWKLLKQEGALTLSDLQSLLGREVTEAAVLRALTELWTTLRVLPVYAVGEATVWELFESRHLKAMHAGGGMAQGIALSALVSLYLDSVIAATIEEIETFLSPLTPRSRIREAVRGLEATRQLFALPLATQTLLHIAGGLPEFPEIAAPVETESSLAPRPSFSPPPFASQPRERRKPFAARDAAGQRPRPSGERKPFAPSNRPRRERPAFGDRPSFGKRPAFGARPAAGGPRKPAGPRKEWQPRTGQARPGTERPEQRPSERKEWKPRSPQGEFRPRRAEGGGGFSKPYRKREGDRPSGPPVRKEWKSRPEGAGEEKRQGAGGQFRPRRTEGGAAFNKPYRSRAGEASTGKPFSPRPPRKDWKSRGEQKSFERPIERKDWKPRGEGAGEPRKDFRPRRTEGSAGKPYASRTGKPSTGRKFQPRDQSRLPRKEWKPRAEGAGEERRTFRPRREGEASAAPRREFKPRPAERRSQGRPEGRAASGDRPRRAGGSFAPKRKPAGEGRSFSKRPFDKARPSGEKPPSGERRPAAAGAKRSAKPFSKPGGRSGPGSKSGGKFGPSRGGKKPAFRSKSSSGSRPGGKSSFGKRKKKSDE